MLRLEMKDAIDRDEQIEFGSADLVENFEGLEI
jgi:hypothetical protein